MLILKKIKERIKKVKERIRKFFGIRLIKSIRDLIIFHQNADFQRKHPNPLNSYGKKCFSQNDEDGITLEFIKSWITKENVLKFYNDSIKNLNEKKTDVLSLDLDGNDIYVLEELLKQIHHPSLIIAEYNAKFPPPIRFKIKYDAQFVWRADDYFGASLSEFVHVLKKYSYKLVCCNSHTGSNAFFIKSDFFDLFKDVPQEIEKI